MAPRVLRCLPSSRYLAFDVEPRFGSEACPSSRNYGIIIKICWDPGIFFFVSIPGAPDTHLRAHTSSPERTQALGSEFGVRVLPGAPSHRSPSVCHRQPSSKTDYRGRLSRHPTKFWTCRSFVNSRDATRTSTVVLVDTSGFVPSLPSRITLSSGSRARS